MSEDLLKIVEDIEAEQALEKVSGASVFKSMLNQPDFLAINSSDADDSVSADSFSEFVINLPRPVLDAEKIQLVNLSAPQCTANIPDTACGFWYYRLNAYSGAYPCINNLHFVRLLPSYYKKELIEFSDSYGFNQTFDSYQDLSAQLDLACKDDLANYQWIDAPTVPAAALQPFFRSQFSPYDVSIQYNAAINKFQMIGNDIENPPAFKQWVSGTTYLVNNKVVNTGKSFRCIQTTSIQPPTNLDYWVQDNGEVIAAWINNVSYSKDEIVSYNNQIYIASEDIGAGLVPGVYPDWDIFDGIWNRYLIAGYKDPNVAKLQGRCYRPWESTFVFEMNDVVEYQGKFYQAKRHTVGELPTGTVWTQVSSTIVAARSSGANLTITCDTTPFIGCTVGQKIYILDNTQTLFNAFPPEGYLSQINDFTFVARTANTLTLSNTLLTNVVSLSGNGGQVCILAAPDIGLNSFSGQWDYAINDIGRIPAQPYSKTVKRLLNTILGFTWNGIFSNKDFGPDYALNETLFLRQIDVSLINRLRPVPDYILIPDLQLGSLRDHQVRITGTYTAEGYCKLAYSSVMALYASIVSGSTLNTTDSTGLLTLASMNCNNLGVSYYQEGISQPLTINGSDIYSIIFRMRDECGEPYILTKNAIVSLVLKVDYKNKKEISIV